MTDLDTDDDQILYIVTALPNQGELILTQFGKEDKILRKDETFTEEQGNISENFANFWTFCTEKRPYVCLSEQELSPLPTHPTRQHT